MQLECICRYATWFSSDILTDWEIRTTWVSAGIGPEFILQNFRLQEKSWEMKGEAHRPIVMVFHHFFFLHFAVCTYYAEESIRLNIEHGCLEYEDVSLWGVKEPLLVPSFSASDSQILSPGCRCRFLRSNGPWTLCWRHRCFLPSFPKFFEDTVTVTTKKRGARYEDMRIGDDRCFMLKININPKKLWLEKNPLQWSRFRNKNMSIYQAWLWHPNAHWAAGATVNLTKELILIYFDQLEPSSTTHSIHVWLYVPTFSWLLW